MWWKYWRFVTLEQKIMSLSRMRTVKKDVIPALIKVCFGTICANVSKIAASYISKVCGVKRVNTCDVV
jgi:hypothetical protein